MIFIVNRVKVFILFLFFSACVSSAENLYTKAFQVIAGNRTTEAIKTIEKINDKNKVIDERSGPSLIAEAARNNNLEVIKFLVEHGANVDTMNGDAYTALLFSIKNGNDKIFDYLFNHGADICSVTKLGETAVDLAEKNKTILYGRIKKLYLEKRCDE